MGPTGLDTAIRGEHAIPSNGTAAAAQVPAVWRSNAEAGGPTIVLTVLVSDEIDLIGPLLEYYFEQGVAFAIVTANRAPEPVLEIVRTYVERGSVTLIREDVATFAQDRWVTRMARLAVEEHAADWVINVDADEFFWPERGTLQEILAAVPSEYGALDVPVYHFAPSREEHRFFADRMTVRETCSLKPSRRAVFSKAIHRGVPDVEVSMGNHRVSGTGLELLRGWQPIVGLHFPLRSWEQFERRVARDLRANPNLGMERYRERLELHRSGRLREAYEREALSEEEIEEGLREGRLVADTRLTQFFKDSGMRAADPPAFDPRRVAELRIASRRAVVEYARHPLAFEADKLRDKLDDALSTRDAARRRLVKAERRRDELKAEIAAVRSTLPFRLGRRFEPLLAEVRRRHGAARRGR